MTTRASDPPTAGVSVWETLDAPEQDVLSPKLFVGEVSKSVGRGLVARAPIASGELVWVSYITSPPNVPLYRWSEICDSEIKIRYAYQVEDDLFTLSAHPDDDPSNFMNHSCDPTTWYDYSLATQVDYFWTYVVEPRLRAAGVSAEAMGQALDHLSAFAQMGTFPPARDPRLLHLEAAIRRSVLDHPGVEFIIARRGIEAGGEATMDYGTFWTVTESEFQCACGAPTCRRSIGREDYRLYEADRLALYLRRRVRAAAEAKRTVPD